MKVPHLKVTRNTSRPLSMRASQDALEMRCREHERQQMKLRQELDLQEEHSEAWQRWTALVNSL